MNVFVLAAVVVVVVLAGFAVQGWRRVQANRAAQQLGGSVGSGPAGSPAGSAVGGVGAPNPALPPAPAPDHRAGILTSGPPVELRVCGLPALAWQRANWGQYSSQPMQLSLIVDTAVGLPFLQLIARSSLMPHLQDTHGPIGVPALDAHFRGAGDFVAWGPVLNSPSVQAALLGFPLEWIGITGGRLTFVSKPGVHLDPGATSAIAQVAAAFIAAVPPQITSAAAAPPVTAAAGAHPTDADAVVRRVLAQQGLSPEQQQAMMALMRATEARQREH